MPRLLVLRLLAALQAAAGAATSTGEIDTAYRPSVSTPTRTAAASGRGAAWAVTVVGGIYFAQSGGTGGAAVHPPFIICRYVYFHLTAGAATAEDLPRLDRSERSGNAF